WTRLQSFAFDDPSSSFPFSAKVAKENGWTRGYTLRVIEEYRRFAHLAVSAGHPVSPSEAVDQAWHIHILYTRQYGEFCRDYLGQFL
ncbi:glycine-rich domain-containing protein, partial [Salmonella enterica]|uniref:glycine-rich domain-containing protein n=1 Tax=Salmonella enterica TaxID=28901 RepID=UPI0032B67E4C